MKNKTTLLACAALAALALATPAQAQGAPIFYLLTVGSRTSDAATTVANGQRFFGSLRPGPVSEAAAEAPVEKNTRFRPWLFGVGLLAGSGWRARRRSRAGKERTT